MGTISTPGSFEHLQHQVEYWKNCAEANLRLAQHRQSVIDELMLEYCPEDMTREQLLNYAQSQRKAFKGQ